MQVCTEDRKLVAEQTHLASVAVQPVAPMALRAQVTAQDGSCERSWAAVKWRREEMPTAARVKKRILAVFLGGRNWMGIVRRKSCCGYTVENEASVG